MGLLSLLNYAYFNMDAFLVLINYTTLPEWPPWSFQVASSCCLIIKKKSNKGRDVFEFNYTSVIYREFTFDLTTVVTWINEGWKYELYELKRSRNTKWYSAEWMCGRYTNGYTTSSPRYRRPRQALIAILHSSNSSPCLSISKRYLYTIFF